MSPAGRLLAEWQPDQVLVLTIDRPEQRNALSPDLLRALRSRLDGDGDEARAIILRGAGHQAFSAGFDLGQLVGNAEDLDADRLIGDVAEALRRCPAPVVAMLRGHCHGAAVEVALNCDLRIAADDLSLSVRAVGLGVVYRYPFLARLSHVVGAGRATQLLLQMPVLDATRALAWGLVSEVVPGAELESRTAEVANGLAHAPVASVRGTKASFRLLEQRWVSNEELDQAQQWRAEAAQSPERREALEKVRRRLGGGTSG